jgi:hypothetical protein
MCISHPLYIEVHSPEHQRATWRAGAMGNHRPRAPAVLQAQRSVRMHRARRALYVDTCFARGAEGGARSCGANCLDLKGKMVVSSVGSAEFDSPEAAGPVNARSYRPFDWELTRCENNLREDCKISTARSNLSLQKLRVGTGFGLGVRG